jgi:hypothetical protein
MKEADKVKFWQRKEVWGSLLTLISYSPEIINSVVGIGILPEHTLVARLVTPIGLILTALGLRDGKKYNNMPWSKGEELPHGLGK